MTDNKIEVDSEFYNPVPSSRWLHLVNEKMFRLKVDHASIIVLKTY